MSAHYHCEITVRSPETGTRDGLGTPPLFSQDNSYDGIAKDYGLQKLNLPVEE